MRTFSLSKLGDSELERQLASLVAQDRVTTATLLAHIAEFDARRLYLPAAYPSMHAYCVGELRMSEDMAFGRIAVARASRRFPSILGAIADGRLSLTSIRLIAPHLTLESADELLASAQGLTGAQVRELIASRFPRSESLELIEALPSVESTRPCVNDSSLQLVSKRVEEMQTDPSASPQPACPRSSIMPIAHDRFLLTLTIGRSTRDKLEHARNLLGHQLPSGNLDLVLERALDALIEKLERGKFAATPRPQRIRRPSAEHKPREGSRHIPAHVKRAVWERDGGQCTFVSENGRRCPAQKLLEFDHVEPVARGGRASVAGVRLRCRAHNQYEAERIFGAQFMRGKREAARGRGRERAAPRPRAALGDGSPEELIVPLRNLGFSAGEARRAARACREISRASLEIRLRRALSFLRPRARVTAAAVRP